MGYIYLGFIGFMIVINVLVMMYCVSTDVVEHFIRKCAI
jgi:hypothetical protein